MADEAAMAADDAESIAAEAAIMLDEAAESAIGVVAGAIVAGVVVVVVVEVSSFLLQAVKDTAAASVTMSNAVFIFLLDSGGSDNSGNCGNPLLEDPIVKDKESYGISRA
ncbi:MAG: hypothetical protein ABI330_05120 [Caldimonas sp.]